MRRKTMERIKESIPGDQIATYLKYRRDMQVLLRPDNRRFRRVLKAMARMHPYHDVAIVNRKLLVGPPLQDAPAPLFSMVYLNEHKDSAQPVPKKRTRRKPKAKTSKRSTAAPSQQVGAT